MRKLYLVVEDGPVHQGIDSLNQFIPIVLESPSRIALRLFDVTQETARHVAVGIPAKVNSLSVSRLKKSIGEMHTTGHVNRLGELAGPSGFQLCPHMRSLPKVPFRAFSSSHILRDVKPPVAAWMAATPHLYLQSPSPLGSSSKFLTA